MAAMIYFELLEPSCSLDNYQPVSSFFAFKLIGKANGNKCGH